MKNKVIIGIAIFFVVCFCCTSILALGGLGYLVYMAKEINIPEYFIPTYRTETAPSNIPVTPFTQPDSPKTTDTVHSSPAPGNNPNLQLDMLSTLQLTEVPISDLRDLSQRYKGLKDVPLTLPPPEQSFQVGETMVFWAVNVDTNVNLQIEATLRYVTDHVYFWIESGLSYNYQELRTLVETFETEIYPTNHQFFGEEWTPGIDSDPHIYILYASGLGSSLAGYFSSADSLPPQLHPYSNGHEMFILNADNSPLGDLDTYGTLAHEFQHMIHWYQDRNEDSWVTEGFSELAILLNGYRLSGFDKIFASQPDSQLTLWPESTADSLAHYGSSYLFFAYFLDRFGDQATQALVRHPENGMASIDAVLAELGIYDPISGDTLHAEDIFLDWAIANYLQDDTIGDGRFDYYQYRNPPQFKETERLKKCPVETQARTINQFGTDYIRLTCNGSYTINWSGSIQTRLLTGEPHSGNYALWSNQGDESAMAITHSFDFREISTPLTLNFWAWYDIEQDFDYLYLSVSVDGENWDILNTPSGTAYNPTGNSLGWGYNGRSGGGQTAEWINETVDLSPYAGKVVQLRFEYVTDGAITGEGFLLDDISIPEIGYMADFESGAGGWELEGWVRFQNALPQSFRLALIKKGAETSVEYISLDPNNVASIPIEISKQTDEVIIVVTATTRFTRVPASYQFNIQ